RSHSPLDQMARKSQILGAAPRWARGGRFPYGPDPNRGGRTPMSDLLSGRTQQRARSRAWQRGAHEPLPGGRRTHAKGDGQYRELAPAFRVRGLGGHGRGRGGDEYTAYGMGLPAVAPGPAHPVAVAAVCEAIGVYRAALDKRVERYLVAPVGRARFAKVHL